MAQGSNPTNFSIEKATLVAYPYSSSSDIQDITLLITGFSISQSLESVAYRGTLTVEDKENAIENIRGEERLTLKIKTYGVLPYQKDYIINAQVYRVDNIIIADNVDGQQYTIHFVSQTSYRASLLSVNEAHRDRRISSIAQSVFKNYFDKSISEGGVDRESLPLNTKKFTINDKYGNSSRSFYLQRTEGQARLLIPTYMPSEAMMFLARRAYSKSSPSCMFRFFETLDGYYFVSDEFLLQRATENNAEKVLFFEAFSSLDGKSMEEQEKTIESISFPRRVDTAEDMMYGSYRVNVLEVNLIRRDANLTTYKYDQFDYKMGNTQDIHNKGFVNETFTSKNAPKYIVYRDYRNEPFYSVSGNAFFKEIAAQRTMFNRHAKNTMISGKLKGRLDLMPGQVVNIPIERVSANRNNRVAGKEIGGNYIIHSVSHSSDAVSIITTNLTLMKFDWQEGYSINV